MELSVIIVSYNVKHYLRQCLTCVTTASDKADAEIIVIDNNSSDESCRMIESMFPSVKLIRNDSNEGFAKACNQGFKIAAGEFILLLNPDTLISEDTFSKCIEFMRAHPDAGAMGVKMADGRGRFLRESKRAIPYPLTAFHKMAGLSRLFPRSSLFSRYYLEHLDRDKTSLIEVLTGAFMFLRKSTLESVGFFDESYFMYGEDIDLSYRILKSGFKIYYYPEITVIHFKGMSSAKNPLKSLVSFYRAMLIFSRKYFSKETPLLYYLLIMPSIYLAASGGILMKLTVKVFAQVIAGRINEETRYLKELYSVKGPAVIAAGSDSYMTIIEKIKQADIKVRISGRIKLTDNESDNDIKGNISNLKDVILTGNVKSVIYSCKSLDIKSIMKSIDELSDLPVRKFIVPD